MVVLKMNRFGLEVTAFIELNNLIYQGMFWQAFPASRLYHLELNTGQQ